MLGRAIWQKTVVGEGEHKETIRISNQLASGTYILILNRNRAFDNAVEVKRVLIIK
jgi:hypothetical protein